MKKYALDREEREILNAIESGEWQPVKLTSAERKKYVHAAKETLKKNKHVHLRMSEADLEGIKTKAAREGIPYQTLIASIVHKYIIGDLVLNDRRSP